MLRVTIEILPHGDESKSRVLGIGYVINNGEGTPDVGHYTVELLKSPEYAETKGVWKRGAVRRFPRKRLGPWDLLYRALRSAVGSRNWVE